MWRFQDFISNRGDKMAEIILDEKEVKGYIKSIINDCVIGRIHMEKDLYHHNTSYKLAPSVIKHGILSIEGMNKKGIKQYSEEILDRMDDISSHVNGKNGVSLSVVGLTDLYPDENEYDPCRDDAVDFLVTREIKTYRMTIHYGNEYVTRDINPDKILSLDIRLLNCLGRLELKTQKSLEGDYIRNIIEKYNHLLEIAMTLKQTNSYIPIREMSNNDDLSLDIEKLSQTSKILIKNKMPII